MHSKYGGATSNRSFKLEITVRRSQREPEISLPVSSRSFQRLTTSKTAFDLFSSLQSKSSARNTGLSPASRDPPSFVPPFSSLPPLLPPVRSSSPLSPPSRNFCSPSSSPPLESEKDQRLVRRESEKGREPWNAPKVPTSTPLARAVMSAHARARGSRSYRTTWRETGMF